MLLHGLDGFNRCRVMTTCLAGHKALGGFKAHHAFHGVQLELARLLGAARLVVQLAFDGVLQQLNCRVEQLLGLNHRVNGMFLERFLGLVLAAHADPLDGIVRADQTRQAYGTAEAREDTQLHFRQSDLGLGGHDTVIGGKTHLETTTQGQTVDCGHRRERQIFNVIENGVGLQVVGHQLFFRPGEKFLEFGNVCTNDEAFLGAGDNQTLDVLARLELVSGFTQFRKCQAVELVDRLAL